MELMVGGKRRKRGSVFEVVPDIRRGVVLSASNFRCHGGRRGLVSVVEGRGREVE